MLTLGRQRLRTHGAAVVVVALTALLALVVLGVLQLLGQVVTDAAARGTMTAATLQDRTISVGGSVRMDRLERTRATIVDAAAAQPGATVTEVLEPISRGIAGRAETDRAVVNVLPDLERHLRVTSGRLPRPGADPLEVVVPEAAAEAGGWQVGSDLALLDLITPDAPRQQVTLVGTVAATSPAAAIWVDAPLALTGVTQGDFTTYGPFFPAAGDRDRVTGASASGRWRIEPALDEVTRERIPVLRAQAERTTGLLTQAAELPRAPVVTRLPQLYAEAGAVADRTRIALLTPTILLMLLGAVALAMAGLQLAALRADDVALLRARGASSAQIVTLAGLDALLVAATSLTLALLVIPVLAPLLARAGGLGVPVADAWSAVLEPTVLVPLLLAAGGAAAIVVATSARAGRLRTTAPPARRSAVLARVATQGSDLVLIGFGVLGLLQLRRYDATAPRVDPLTLAAPALVIGGLCVLGLRIIPWLATIAARAAGRRRGLTAAWGSWQVARRLGGQSGAVLLVFLSVAMGSLALAQSATLGRAIEDQTRFRVGAPFRVAPGGELRGDPALAATFAQIAGGADRVMAVFESTVELGSVKGASLLAVDPGGRPATFTPRPDVVAGTPWSQLVQGISVPTSGAPIPAGARRLEVSVKVDALDKERAEALVFPMATRLQIALPSGERIFVRADPITGRGLRRVAVTLPHHPGGWPGGTQLVGLVATPRVTASSLALPAIEIWLDDPAAITVDGKAVAVRDAGPRARRVGVTTYLPFGEPASAAPQAIPVVITQDVAEAIDRGVGEEVTLSLVGASVPGRITAIVGALPTAADPERAVLVALGGLSRELNRPYGSSEGALTTPLANSWLLNPVDAQAARAALQANPRLAADIQDTASLTSDRAANPVNSGMRAALRLVTGAALMLSTLGFAVATAALSLARHREGSILLALGTPMRLIRRAVFGERLVVLVLSALVGLGAGIIATRAVVALVIGTDGVAQLPPVIIDFALRDVLVFVVAVLALLASVAVLVIGRTSRDLGEVLRAGERS